MAEQIVAAGSPDWQRKLVEQAVKATEDHYNVSGKLAELKKWRRRSRIVARKIARLERELVAEMRGLKPEHVCASTTVQHYSYGDRTAADPLRRPAFSSDDFRSYPAGAREVMMSHAQSIYVQQLETYPMTHQLLRLREKTQGFNDRLVACANHQQLERIWVEVNEQFGALLEDNGDRQLRKVVARNTTKAKK